MTAEQSKPLALFKKNYEDLAGQVYVAESPVEALRCVKEILVSRSVRQLVHGPLPRDLQKELDKFLKHSPVATVNLDLADPRLHQKIAKAEVGITAAQFAIAFTGTIVEVTAEDAHRLVSSLPRVHIALLPAAQIVYTLDDAVPRLREIVQAAPAHCNVTFISGPSRTADIEMKLVLGVHGPQESHVIVCTWEPKRSPFKKFLAKIERG